MPSLTLPCPHLFYSDLSSSHSLALLPCISGTYNNEQNTINVFHSSSIKAPLPNSFSVHLDDDILSWRSLPKNTNITAISSVAMQEEDSDIIEVRHHDELINTLEVLVNGEVISFEEQSWMDMKGMLA